MKLNFVIFFAILFVTGCTGKFYTVTDIEEACEKRNKAENCIKYNGVFVRPLKPVTERIIRDRILDDKGNVTHFINGKGQKECLPLEVEVTKLVADTTNNQIVHYEPGIFETSSFSLELNSDGTIKSVGTSSTHGGKALVESLVALKTTFDPKKVNSDKNGQEEKSVNAPYCSHGELLKKVDG